MFVWTPDMIRFMQAANEKSDYHACLAAILAPKLSGCRTLCDAGCGLGALSAALSPYFEQITAADVSDEALDVLRQTIQTRQLTNITPLHCDLLTSEDKTQYDAMVFCFFRIYSRDETPGAITPEAVLARLRRTDDVRYPYYLPQTKRLGILTIRMEDLV